MKNNQPANGLTKKTAIQLAWMYFASGLLAWALGFMLIFWDALANFPFRPAMAIVAIVIGAFGLTLASLTWQRITEGKFKDGTPNVRG